jgi:hypothetical protein
VLRVPLGEVEKVAQREHATTEREGDNVRKKKEERREKRSKRRTNKQKKKKEEEEEEIATLPVCSL